MREPRVKISNSESDAVYHCVSKTVNGEYLFDDAAKEVLRRYFWQIADFCGVNILTYSILDNHFHVLVHVPLLQPISDQELLRRYRLIHPKPSAHRMERLDVLEAELLQNTPAAAQWRSRQLRRMGDVSQYMKLVKQSFSSWFNKVHQRFGPLWSERFRSTLVGPSALLAIAAYIDLNPVRAGLTDDPKEYRFSGYAEAVAGNRVAQAGLQWVTEAHDLTRALSHYRELLYGIGGTPRNSKAMLPVAEVQRVLAEGGKLPLATLLRCRFRYFTHGVVLGSRTFVETQLAARRRRSGSQRQLLPQALPPCTEWGDIVAFCRLRGNVFG